MVVAAFYTVHIVERPNNWYPYGFDKTGLPCYTEYYKNALADVYKDKTGYLYSCADVKSIENPTNINCAYACEQPVPVRCVLKIEDMYRWFLEQEKKKKLQIVRYDALTEKQIDYCSRMVTAEIENFNLRLNPDSSYSKFISKRFPQLWKL